MDENKALEKAKINLMLNKKLIFFTTLLFSIKQKFSNEVPTAGVNLKELIINSEFWLKLSEAERIFILVHEVMHLALSHVIRGKDKNKIIYNMAGDYVINLMCSDMKLSLPKGVLLNERFRNLSTEEVYDILMEEAEEAPKDFDQDIQYSDSGDEDQEQQELDTILIKAKLEAERLNQIGNIPAEVLIELGLRQNPKLPWYVILQNCISDITHDDYSMLRPNRRFLPDFYLPSLYSEGITKFVIFADLSYSMSDEQVNQVVTEIDAIHKLFEPDELIAIGFDTELKEPNKISTSESVFQNIKFNGRGGTDINPVVDWINKNEPTLAIIFTDGEFYLPKYITKNVPIFWIILNNPEFKIQTGQVIHYD